MLALKYLHLCVLDIAVIIELNLILSNLLAAMFFHGRSVKILGFYVFGFRLSS